MSELTKEKLVAALQCSDALANKWLAPIVEAMGAYAVTTPQRQAAFLAQIGHESGSLTIVEENLRYSAHGLLATFPKHFTAELAELYAKMPEKIGSRVYAGRMGNGDEASGDGYRYRGRGLIQLTGKSNYQACGGALGLSLVDCPELLTEPGTAAKAAGWFWDDRSINDMADTGSFEKMTRAINGGLNGYIDRLDRWTRAKQVLGA